MQQSMCFRSNIFQINNSKQSSRYENQSNLIRIMAAHFKVTGSCKLIKNYENEQYKIIIYEYART